MVFHVISEWMACNAFGNSKFDPCIERDTITWIVVFRRRLNLSWHEKETLSVVTREGDAVIS